MIFETPQGMMKMAPLAVCLALFVSCGAISAQFASVSGGSADFLSAAKEYIEFTTSHCDPDEVDAYRSARLVRDSKFADSIKGTALQAEYANARSETTEQDSRTVYECMQPPAPPGVTPDRLAPAEIARHRAEEKLKYFHRADQLFASMVAARDAVRERRR